MYIKGDLVAWVAEGKVSRLDGVAGNSVRGHVIRQDEHGVHIRKEYKSIVQDCVVEWDKVRLI